MSATERRLEVLAVLQARPGITATALAERFAVSERTARRDVDHLRRIGYGIEGEAGRHGGYALAGGTKLPPLLLDADEAAAVALGLAGDLGVSGLELAAGTALAKVTELAPSRARGALAAVGTAVLSEPDRRSHGSSRVLLALAHACRQGTSVHLRQRDAGGAEHRRTVQPHRLVKIGARWYLVAFAAGRDAWSVYAVSSDHPGRPVRRPAGHSPAARGRGGLRPGLPGHRTPPAPRRGTAAHLGRPGRELVGPATGTIDDEGSSCVLSLATDDLDWAARYLVYLNLDFDVLAPAALSTALHDLGDWLSRRHPG